MWIAGGHDDRSGDLRAVDQADAAHPSRLTQDRVDRTLGAQGATLGFEGGEQGPWHFTAAADRPADVADVTHRRGQGSQPGTGRLRRDSPHHRPVQRGRTEHRIVVEVRPQDVGGAAPRPAQQRWRPGEFSTDGHAGEPAYRGRLAGRIEDHSDGRDGRLRVPAISVGLFGQDRSQRLDGRVDVVGVRPRRVRPVPGQVVLSRFDVEVSQTVLGQAEFLDHGSGAERQVVAVADVDRRAGELFARRGSTDVGACFEQQGPQAGAGQVGSGHEPVVPRSDHDRVVVRVMVRVIVVLRRRFHHGQSLAHRSRRRSVPVWHQHLADSTNSALPTSSVSCPRTASWCSPSARSSSTARTCRSTPIC